MVYFRVLSLLSLLMLYSEVHTQEVYGVVTFNMRGVNGVIEFRQLDNGSMMITSDLSGFEMKHGWHVHTLPVDTSLPPSDRCSNDFVGLHFDPFNALDNPNYKEDCSPTNRTACEVGDLSGKLGHLLPSKTYIDDVGDLTLFGRYGIMGRSIKIHGTEDVCGTIRSSSELGNNPKPVAFLHASFIYPYGGVMYFRQVEGESAMIWGKVYWTNTSVSSTDNRTINHKWHVHLDTPGVHYRVGNCSLVKGHFNPYNVDINAPEYVNCNEDNITNCEVGDLSGKHGLLNIPISTSVYQSDSFFFQDSFLNLTGANAVLGRSIAIHSHEGNKGVQGCAPLVSVERLYVATTDNFFKSSQTSRYDQTKIDSHNMYTNSDYKIFSSAIAPNGLCKDEFTAGSSRVYNPHNAPTPDGTDETPDRFSVGNLSAKHMNIHNGGYFDELPIHGLETIAGHSFGLSYDSNGNTAYTCRTLRPNYPSGATIKMAKATFNGTVQGAFYFTQQNFGDGVFGNTYMFIDLWYNNSDMRSTTGHNYHIHEKPPVAGAACMGNIGGHFNPFKAELSDESGYKTYCDQNSPLRCESGDLSKKHGQLNIDPISSTRRSYTYTDPSLNLFGPSDYSIVGRSVGLHLPASDGGNLFDCAKIEEVVMSTKPVTVTFDYNEDFDRANFVRMATSGVEGASPSDVLIDSQTMTLSESGRTSSVNASLLVLGTTESDANEKARSVESNISGGGDSSSSATVQGSIVLLISVILLQVCSSLLFL